MQPLSRANERGLAGLTAVLATPLAFGSREEWYSSVTRAMREFFRGDAVFLCTPDRGARLYFADDQPMCAAELDAWITYDNGEVTSADAAFDSGFAACRRRRLCAFTSPMIDHLIGHRLRESVVYNDVIRPAGAQVSIGCGSVTSCGEMMCSVTYNTAEPSPFALRMLPLFSLIAPLLATGYETFQRMDEGRKAWLDALGGLSDACLVYDTERDQEIHRNLALAVMQRSDPEASVVVDHMQRIARDMTLSRASVADCAAEALAAAALAQTREVTTARGRYLLRATLLPPGACCSGCAVVVLARSLSTALPSAVDLRARFGLTEREADVALHLAAGMTDDAIARRIGVSSHTARHHSEHVRAKLGLQSRTGLGLFLLRSCQD